MTVLSSETLHASCVAIGGRAVLIEGRSGAGKSDLALRLIDRGAALVSDDYVQVRRQGGILVANPPAHISGKIEVRGVGIVEMAHVADIPAALIVSLGEPEERLPEAGRARSVAGVMLPAVALDAFHASTPIKVEQALARVS